MSSRKLSERLWVMKSGTSVCAEYDFNGSDIIEAVRALEAEVDGLKSELDEMQESEAWLKRAQAIADKHVAINERDALRAEVETLRAQLKKTDDTPLSHSKAKSTEMGHSDDMETVTREVVLRQRKGDPSEWFVALAGYSVTCPELARATVTFKVPRKTPRVGESLRKAVRRG